VPSDSTTTSGIEMTSMTVEFCDTNVLVYAYDGTEPKKHASALSLVERLWEERSGALSIQVLGEFYVTVRRKIPKPLSAPEARSALADLSTWTVHTPSAETVLSATDIAERYQLNYWDALIVQAARELGALTLWSEDLRSGATYQGVRVRNPFAED